MNKFEFFCPFPSKDLSPNARVHWSKLAKAKKKAKADTFWLAKESGLGKIEADEIRISLTFYPPTRARYDDDGLISRCKAHLDAISDVVGVDDRHFRIKAIQRGPVEKNGMLKIGLEWDD